MPFEARAPMRTIVVVGDGQVGLAAAIALRRALPKTDVILTTCNPDASALADRTLTSQPRTNMFHARIGLEEKALIHRCGASHRLAVRFLDWREPGSAYLNAHGAHSTAGLSVTQELAGINYFALPVDDGQSPLSDLDYAMRFDHRAYHKLLGALAQHLGITYCDSPFVSAATDKANNIGHIILADGTHLTADLFIDCTGLQRLIINALIGASFRDWSTILPCNRLMVKHKANEPVLSVTDIARAHSFGWQTVSFGRDGTHHMLAYNADCTSDADVIRVFEQEPDEVFGLKPGRLQNSWVGNVVAFGDAAAAFEPLLNCNLSLSHEQILLFLELLPGRTFDDLERAEYNRRAGAMADRIRDFIALHYCGSSKPEGSFWRHIAAQDRPESLVRTHSEFERRGRLPFFEENIMSRDAWLSAMDCIGTKAGATTQMLAASDDAMKTQQYRQKMRSKSAREDARPYAPWLENYIKRQV
jgi:tryptophan 7-halogenase